MSDEPVDVDVMPALFGLAADWFAATVEAVPPDGWDATGLGEWTVRELVAHAMRALTTLEQYLVLPPEADELDIEIDDAAEYLRVGLSAPGIDAAVAERARATVPELGADPAATVRATVERVVARIDDVPDGAVCRTPIGTMLLEDYLATRITELVVHSLDLRAALGLPLDPPAGPAVVVLHVIAEVVGRADRGEVLLALAGRRPLPEGWSAFRITAP